MDKHAWILFIILGFFVGLFIGAILGADRQIALDRNEAVKANVSHWETNSDGSPVFRWNKNPELLK